MTTTDGDTAKWKYDGVRVIPGDSLVVNLDIEPVEKPEEVPWIDPIHKS